MFTFSRMIPAMNERELGRIYESPGLRWNPKFPDDVKSLPMNERPREKLLSKGAAALSDLELLAVTIGSGVRGHSVLSLASRALRDLDGRLGRVNVEALTKIKGLGEAKACQIAAAFELARRHLTAETATIQNPNDVLPYLRDIRETKQEHFSCLSLTGANEVIAFRVVTVGLLDSSQVHPREVFADPIADRAAAVILAHNHPSGTLAASAEDRALTSRLLTAGEILGIRVLDHLIVTNAGMLSMQQEGLLRK